MKKLTLFLIVILFIVSIGNTQNVSINGDGSNPDASAMLDIKASDKGLLIPRVTLTGTDDNTTISSPAAGLLIYNTATAGTPGTNAVSPGFYYYNGSSWAKVGTGVTDNDWTINGNDIFSAVSGNVGIGTNSPGEKLEVNGNISTQDIEVSGGDITTTSALLNINQINDGEIRFYTNFNSLVGTFYSQGLIVGAQSTGNSHIIRGTGSASAPVYSFFEDEDTGIYRGGVDVLNFTTGGSNRMTIKSDGRIGISTVSNPSFLLELPNIASDAGGRARAESWVTYSDSRIKTKQRTIEYGLNSIMQIKPKSYTYHSNKFDNGKIIFTKPMINSIGLIAQELYEIIPEAVYKPKDENIDLWAVDYNKLIPVLIKAIQEQQSQINDLIKKQKR